jgi:hypothetical protein
MGERPGLGPARPTPRLVDLAGAPALDQPGRGAPWSTFRLSDVSEAVAAQMATHAGGHSQEWPSLASRRSG